VLGGWEPGVLMLRTVLVLIVFPQDWRVLYWNILLEYEYEYSYSSR
jgi:hypothetical protein